MSFNLSVKYNNSSVIKDTVDDDIEASQNISAGFGIAGLCFIIFGIFGNIIAIVVLRQKPMRCLGTKLLVYLAFVDILFLVLGGLRSVNYLLVEKVAIRALSELNNVMRPPFMTVYMAEIYMTSLITVQRYVSVTKPLVAKRLMSERRLVIIMAVLGAWCVIFNIPLWLVFYPVFYYNTDMNITWIRHDTYVMPNNVPFYESTFYATVYSRYLDFIFHFLIPVSAMFIFNILIVRTIKQQFRQSQQMKTQSDNSDSRLTITIIAITTSSLVASFPHTVDFALFEILNWEAKCSLACITCGHVAILLVTVNCSLNCVFYCVCGSKFRQICWGLLCPT
ncbi:FMRFamide receptor-like [Gigantopelta aegis]|uniref:FMRFamide receptor-like n=1 Tax=Gigantopelta aegis TaxID=1735272 RepID=UPI001B88CFDE|nr:FMRFamide receptor-like [Gigantopelta aegis]